MSVHQRLTWREKAAMQLAHVEGTHGTKPKHLPRDKLMSIRRLAHKGYSAPKIMAELGIDMSDAVFRKRCRELQIRFVGNNRNYVGERE